MKYSYFSIEVEGITESTKEVGVIIVSDGSFQKDK